MEAVNRSYFQKQDEQVQEYDKRTSGRDAIAGKDGLTTKGKSASMRRGR